MSDDDLALALLLLGPIATALVTYGLFGVARLHTRRGFEIGGLLLGNALGLALCLSLLAAMGELYFRFVYDTRMPSRSRRPPSAGSSDTTA